ncbi:integral membrane protein MviN, partial [mine drainage metagenome]
PFGLTRITLASIFFHSLNGVLIGTEYAYNTYWGTALGPLAYNVVIIIVGVILAAPLGIYAFAWSTLAGAFINFLIQVVGVLRIRGATYFPSIAVSHPGIRRILHLIVPVAIGLSIAQLNLLINQSFLASTLAPGSLNALMIASRVMLVPIMFAISIGITLLPNLTRQAAVRDLPSFRRSFSNSLRAVIFISIPASVGLLVLADPIIQVL